MASAADRTIEFFLYNKKDLATVRRDCFELSSTNSAVEFVELNKKSRHYTLTLDDSIIPGTLTEITAACPRLQKTYKIDGVLTRELVTTLDKVLIPICLILVTLAAGFMVYYKNFSKYKNIIEIDEDSDADSQDGNQDNDDGQQSKANFENASGREDGKSDRSNLTYKSKSGVLDVQRNDSVIPGKIKSIGMFANNTVEPLQEEGGKVANITVNIGSEATSVSPTGKRRVVDSGEVNLYKK